MSIAERLIAEVAAFGERNPGHERSVQTLIDSIRRIDTQFTGETRGRLLEEARRTFHKQIEILETAERTRAALERLEQNQVNLARALEKIDAQTRELTRPDGATLH